MGGRVFCERNLGLVIREEVVSYVSSGICLFCCRQRSRADHLRILVGSM